MTAGRTSRVSLQTPWCDPFTKIQTEESKRKKEQNDERFGGKRDVPHCFPEKGTSFLFRAHMIPYPNSTSLPAASLFLKGL